MSFDDVLCCMSLYVIYIVLRHYVILYVILYVENMYVSFRKRSKNCMVLSEIDL